mmetsp:Transcript_108566/g.197654  ORF Transcript_108566/g.197654 Transcript_108566/m.197654 type:complete len:639 (+) Transcript_108566:92-2008(+)
MKRASACPLEGASKRLAGVSARSDNGSADAAANVAAQALLAHSPSLAVPPPRTAWGLDRLVLDGRCAEGAVRTWLRAGGSDLPASLKGTSLPQGTVLSLPGSGQGLAAAVGLAIGQRNLAATYSQPNFQLFEHRVFVLCMGAALPSGVVSEAASLAGHLRLGCLTALCCDDGKLGMVDTVKRYESYGWCVVNIAKDAGSATLDAALEATRHAERPTLILIRDGSAEATVNTEACQHHVDCGIAMANRWQQLFANYGKSYPEAHAEILRRFKGELPKDWNKALPEYAAGDRAQATRQCSAAVLGSLVSSIPEIIGGSADLTGSNLTNQGKLKDFQHNSASGRYIRFGVREHSMIAICTGLAAYGGFLPYCGTFMNFFTYGWGALRLACEVSAHAIYVATHDSIELGEDGPTHQPIEVLPALRAMPNLLTIRPADGTETAGAYEVAMQNTSRPSLLALSRSGTPHLEGTSREGVARGAYVLSDFDAASVPLVLLAASGTEVALCVEVKSLLQRIGVGARVVSMPSWELFEEQEPKYKQTVLEPSFSGDVPLPQGMRPLRVYVEASSTLGVHRYADLQIGMTTFGVSAPAKDAKKYFGFDKNPIASKILDELKGHAVVDSYKVGRFGFCKFGSKIRAAMTI